MKRRRGKSGLVWCVLRRYEAVVAENLLGFCFGCKRYPRSNQMATWQVHSSIVNLRVDFKSSMSIRGLTRRERERRELGVEKSTSPRSTRPPTKAPLGVLLLLAFLAAMSLLLHPIKSSMSLLFLSDEVYVAAVPNDISGFDALLLELEMLMQGCNLSKAGGVVVLTPGLEESFSSYNSRKFPFIDGQDVQNLQRVAQGLWGCKLIR